MKIASTYGDRGPYVHLLLASSISAAEATSTHMQNPGVPETVQRNSLFIPLHVYGCAAPGKICLQTIFLCINRKERR